MEHKTEDISYKEIYNPADKYLVKVALNWLEQQQRLYSYAAILALVHFFSKFRESTERIFNNV